VQYFILIVVLMIDILSNSTVKVDSLICTMGKLEDRIIEAAHNEIFSRDFEAYRER
jgi:hypothetical protein